MNSEIKRLEMRIKFGGGGEELDLIQSAALRDLMNAYESQITTLTAERDGLNDALSLAGKDIDRLTAELAALKTAPGTDEVEAISTALLDVLKHIQDHFDVNIAGVNAMRRAKELIESARRSIAARDEAVGLLKHILSCIITVRQENTPEWMEYIAEEVNRINEAMGS